MADVLVLIRHGKAQTRNETRPDFERTLTEAGKRSLAVWLPRSARLLAEERIDTVELWASPAIRALVTAQLVAEVYAKELGKKKLEIVEKPCLWEQDIDEFLDDVRACTADVVVAVGHNPSMEDACAEVCGCAVPLATGGVVAVKLDAQAAPQQVGVQVPQAAVAQMPGYAQAQPFGFEPAPSEGRLLWMMQGPESKRWKAIVDVEDVIADAAGNVEARREAFFANPDDVEAAHKYRVSIRTIRGLLSFVEPYLQRGQYADMQRDWKSLVGCTSRLREYDVLAGEVAQLDPPAEALLEACGKARYEECSRTLDYLDTKGARTCFKRVLKASRNLAWKRSYREEGFDADTVAKRFEQVVEQERADLESLDLADVERTHDVRKQAKQVRYAAERFGELIGEGADEVADEMKGVQDRLGALCDARVNVDIIDEFSTKGLPDEALWALSLLRAQNEQFIYSTLRDQE